MFSFHKPRVYRSAEGCCICRAKSSSSRFTDSKKYEDDSMKCFNLDRPRKGEICNACVLLVKRFKRLPVGSNRHWGHVVDARIGPGLKSMSKFKKMKDDSNQQSHQQNKQKRISSNEGTKSQNSKSSSIPEKFCKIFKKNKTKQILRSKDKNLKQKREGTPASWDEQSLPPTPESLNADFDYTQYSGQQQLNHAFMLRSRNKINRRKLRKPKKRLNTISFVNFFDENDWKRLKTCCGIVFENTPMGALIVDIQTYKPCTDHISLSKNNSVNSTNTIQTNAVVDGNKAVTTINEITCDPLINADYARKMNLLNGSSTKIAATKIITEQQPQQQSLFPVLKKHHLFLKRQMKNFPYPPSDNLSTIVPSTNIIKTEPDSTIISKAKLQLKDNDCGVGVNVGSTVGNVNTVVIRTDAINKCKTTILHHHPHQQQQQQQQHLHHQQQTIINKFDSGKVVKHSSTADKINTLCVKQADLLEVNGLIKIATERPLKSKTICTKLINAQEQQQLVCNNKIIDPFSTKFSDNSSDSGFDENMLERKSTSPPGEDKKILIHPVQTMFLTNGVQICGQQQNLILTANNVAAKLLQERQTHVLAGTKTVQNNGCQKVSAIFNQSTEGGVGSGLITLAAGSKLSPMANLASTVNQKFILVKAKYNNQPPATN